MLLQWCQYYCENLAIFGGVAVEAAIKEVTGFIVA